MIGKLDYDEYLTQMTKSMTMFAGKAITTFVTFNYKPVNLKFHVR